MNLKTRFSEGDFVFCLDKKGQVRERKIMGIRTQSLFGKQKTNYSFLKDAFISDEDYLQNEYHVYSDNDFFWLPENKVYASKNELLSRL